MHGILKVFVSKIRIKNYGYWAVKSSIGLHVREKIKEALKILMSGSEKNMNKFIQDFRKQFMNLSIRLVAYLEV